MAKSKLPRLDAAEPVVVAAKSAVTYDRHYVRHFVLEPSGKVTLVLRPYSSVLETELDDAKKNVHFEFNDIKETAASDATAAKLLAALYEFAAAQLEAKRV